LPLRWRAWWQQFITHVDATPLLADYGFAPRTAFASELGHRLLRKWLPPTPETTDLSQLFHLLFPQAFDAKWIRALDPATLQHAERLLFAPATQGAPAQDGQPGLWEDSVAEPAVAPPHIVLATTASAWGQPVATYWQNELIEAIAYSVSQISATGFASEIRMRMAEDAETQRAFHSLSHCMDTWTRQLGIHGLQHPETLAATELLREQLAHCRRAAGTVYAHLAEQGVSVGIVFRLRQMRDRVQRVNELLDCLFSQNSAHSTARLVARLIMVGQERRSVRNLIRSSSDRRQGGRAPCGKRRDLHHAQFPRMAHHARPCAGRRLCHGICRLVQVPDRHPGAINLLGRSGRRHQLCGDLRADPAAALDHRHQAARRDGPGTGSPPQGDGPAQCDRCLRR
jgi:hypothetical protein